MPTIILAKDGIALQQLTLLKERTTIGRRSYNDIVIDSPGISAEHAVIVAAANEAYFEDLGSTNGSRFDGKAVKKHLLQDKDEIELATHTIRYCTGKSAYDPAKSPAFADDGMEQLGDIRQVTAPLQEESATTSSAAKLRILNGFGKGREVRLTKVMTTVGWPGVQVAVLSNTPQGYSLTHVEGNAYPRVNGISIGEQTQALANGDVIALSGAEMLFVY